ncbi:MAG: hypothetical protein GWN83_08465, partial [Gemmatimonadetes bacterium]|nr:hypothetical protein [Gemmatimonadota bacterium]
MFYRIVLLAAALSLQACYPITYSAEEIEARVVDAGTKEPLEGVIVTANWQLVGGWEGHTPKGQMKVMETVT